MTSFLTFIAAGEPAGGAPVQDLVPAAVVAAVMTTVVLAVGLGRRAGRITVLTRLATLAERVIPVPGWAALPVLVTLGSLGIAAFGFFWDVATHIDNGRDAGPFANVAHYPILAGLAGVALAGFLAAVLGADVRDRAAIDWTPGWRIPLGGNIANASPIGDSMPILIALAASVVLRRGDATRELPLEDFYLAYQKTARLSGEIVTGVRVPLPSPDRKIATYKISKRFDQDISAVCGAYSVELEQGRVRQARVAYGGMAATPKRAPRCEQALEGKLWNEITVQEAMLALDADYAPITDMRASRDYRASVARNLLYRFFLETSGSHARTRVIEYAE